MELIDYREQFEQIILSSIALISNIKPSEWVEQNVIMGKPFPGPYRYSRTPYCREIIDCLAADHPSRKIAVMKGAQIGLSAGVIIPAMGYIIKESPGNTYFTVGAPDLIEKASEKLDIMIDNAGLRSYLKPQALRKRAQKSGDTNTKKDFAGGYINITTPNNHKEWRDVSLKYGFVDDFESAKSASKESGSTMKLMEQRFAAYADSHKIFYISTPELKSGSNIEPAYLLGDQRKYMTPCPCCGEFIEWVWAIEENGITGGVTWEVDENGELVKGSVGYTCQKCGGFFDDKKKSELLNAGYWQPTAKPSSPDFYSYHISSLYAPLGMYDWEHYVRDWINIHPVGQPRKESEYKTFVTVVLGLTYSEESEAPKANAIQRNTRDYKIKTIPEKQSIKDGNGRIVLLTCGSDMNGTKDDARLDYEIVAHSESGSTYSICHGSIGTFIPRENTLVNKIDRERWTYEEKGARSVWPEFEKIINQSFSTEDGRAMKIALTGLDCGHHSQYAYTFIEKVNLKVKRPIVVGVKGDKEDQNIRFGIDVKHVKPARERINLWILQVGLIKDKLAGYMGLRWIDLTDSQPNNFMNYPQPADGLYGFSNFFEHYEAEQRVVVKGEDNEGVASRWVKKTSVAQNHLWDCRVYNLAVVDIYLELLSKEYKQKITYAAYASVVRNQLEKK